MTTQFWDEAGNRLELTLFKNDVCPFCVRVLRYLKSKNLELPMRDTREEPGAREELRRLGGKTQVPCLIINGEAMYESNDIIEYIDNRVLHEPPPN